MKNLILKSYKIFIILMFSLIVLGAQPVQLGEEKTFFHGYSIPKPIIKVGLGVNLGDVKISSSSGMNVYEVNHNYKFLTKDINDVYIKGYKEKFSEKFAIQVVQTGERKKAERLAQELRSRVEHNVFVKSTHKKSIGGNFRVMVGDFISRGDALEYIKKLQEMGMENMWIVREEITEDQSRPLWIIFGDEVRSLSDHSVLYFIPSNPQSYLSYKGRDYRGIFVLKASRKGVILINILNIEDYLKGVVPSELSPYSYPSLEAQKAQAVAARTYAIKNIGLNGDKGFDLCDTPKSQYYKGMDAEHPLSTQAVESTRGEVAVYNGKLIDALYTSTCGGRTEDVENIFLGPSLPYLRSTKCVYEKQKEWQIHRENKIPPVYVNNRNVNREISFLISLEVLPRETDPLFYREEISSKETLEWVWEAQELFGKKDGKLVLENSPVALSDFVMLVTRAFGWRERAESLTLKSEREFVLKNSENWGEEVKKYTAYLFQTGIFPPTEQSLLPDEPLSRGEVAFYLARIVESYQGIYHHGIFRGFKGDQIKLEEEKKERRERIKRELTLSPEAFLLKSFGVDWSFTSQYYLLGGERIRWLEKDQKICYLEVEYPPHSNILDRSSAYHSWRVRYSRERLGRRINRYYPIGELVDLVPQKKGKSNRVIQLLIEGTETDVVVKGLRIRRLLGLKETLFVIDRNYGEGGEITHFTFCGRGWGHGVGLCQVGAHGMAQSGADYKEILKKYYQGIKIKENFE